MLTSPGRSMARGEGVELWGCHRVKFLGGREERDSRELRVGWVGRETMHLGFCFYVVQGGVPRVS